LRGRLFKKTDLFVILALLIAALILAALRTGRHKQGDVQAQIYFDRQLVYSSRLHQGQEERSFSLDQAGGVVFRLTCDAGICFESSDCPDKICVRSGVLRYAGQSAACIPNRLILKIVSTGGDSDLDMVIG
jgi:hypothetical protein